MKKMLITGGSGDIGQALISYFKNDYDITYTYFKNNENITGATGLFLDIKNPKLIEKTFSNAEFDILINNAGVSLIKLLQDSSYSEIVDTININLTGAILITKYILPYMIRQKNGCIINISSLWGDIGSSLETVYSASKAGIIGFTKALSKEVGPSNIRVNCISPGMVDTKMNNFFTECEILTFIQDTILQKIGNPSDIAKVCSFLIDAQFISGVNIPLYI